MPIPIVGLEFGDAELVTVYCPTCGMLVIEPEVEPVLCAHTEFVYFPAGDMEYITEELAVVVTAWQEQADEQGVGFDLVEALCSRRDDPTSFVFEISWAGLPERLWVGFRLSGFVPEG